MTKRLQAQPRDSRRASESGDSRQALAAALRDARLSRGLSQKYLADRLGLHQRQISDLERAAMDPRVSTVQNVARALDLDLMLIPRRLIATVESLQRAGTEQPTGGPLYSLGNEDE